MWASPPAISLPLLLSVPGSGPEMAATPSDHRDLDSHDSPQAPAGQTTTSSSFCCHDGLVESRGPTHAVSKTVLGGLFRSQVSSQSHIFSLNHGVQPLVTPLVGLHYVLESLSNPDKHALSHYVCAADLLPVTFVSACVDGARPHLVVSVRMPWPRGASDPASCDSQVWKRLA